MTTLERRLLTRLPIAALAILAISCGCAALVLKLVGAVLAPMRILLLASPLALVGLALLALLAIGTLAAAASYEYDL